MKTVVLVSLLLSVFRASGQSMEVFKPSRGEVLDYHFEKGELHINTTRGQYVRVMQSVYLPSGEPYSKSSRTKGEVDSIRINDGALYISHNPGYRRRYINHSVRHNDSLYLGTYSGAYLKNTVFPVPCGGAIRTKNGRIYICFGGLAVLENETLVERYCDVVDAKLFIAGQNLGVLNDIAFYDNNWIFNTSVGVFKLDESRNIDTLFIPSILDGNNQFNGRFITDDTYIIEGFIGNTWFTINKSSEKFQIEGYYEGEITHIDETQGRIVTTSDFIYILNNKKLKFNNKELKLHGTFRTNSNLYGFSNEGLCLINLSNDKLEAIPVFRNEFNKHSLRISSDSIYLGSVNGLWSFSKNNMPRPIKIEAISLNPKLNSEDTLKNALIAFLAIMYIFTFVFFKKSKLGRDLKIKRKIVIDQNSIMEFIDANLTAVTILSILNEFDISQKTLYELFAPEKPGEVIKIKRLKKLQDLYVQGSTIVEMANMTGFSKDYISKVLLPELRMNKSVKS